MSIKDELQMNHPEIDRTISYFYYLSDNSSNGSSVVAIEDRVCRVESWENGCRMFVQVKARGW